jgi:hypothetical protein
VEWLQRIEVLEGCSFEENLDWRCTRLMLMLMLFCRVQPFD